MRENGGSMDLSNLVSYYNTKPCHNQEDLDLKHHGRESLKTLTSFLSLKLYLDTRLDALNES